MSGLNTSGPVATNFSTYEMSAHETPVMVALQMQATAYSTFQFIAKPKCLRCPNAVLCLCTCKL